MVGRAATWGTAVAGLVRRMPRSGLGAAQWYFLLFTLLCIGSTAVAVAVEPLPAAHRLVALAVAAGIAAVRIAEYRRGRPLPWPADLGEIAGLALLVSLASLGPGRSLLFGCLMFRAVTGALGRVLTLQAGYIGVLVGAALTEGIASSALGGDVTGLVLQPITLFLLRTLLLAGERDRGRQHRLLSTLLHNVPTGVVVSDLAGRLQMVNQATRQLLHLPQGEDAPLPPSDSVRISTADGVPVPADDSPLARALDGHEVRGVEYLVAAGGQAPRRVVINAEPLADTDGVRLGAVLTLHDVTEQRDQQHLLDHLVDHDPLTGLPNRHHLGRRIDDAAAAGPVVVLHVGLDRFKQVNESLGRHAGDEVLIAAAGRIRDAVGDAGCVARLEGDEFGVLLDQAGHADTVANGIVERLAQPFRIDQRPLLCGASVGIAPHSGGTAGDVLRDADLAMYAAKSAGGGQAHTFTADLRDEVTRRIRLEADLRQAVHGGGLTAYFQPIVDLCTDRVRAVEVLARWPHPTLGMIGPDRFIPLAEANGLIDAIGEQMLRNGCRSLAETPGCAWDLSVNVAPAQLRAAGFPDLVLAVLAETGVAPRRLILEITESMLSEEDEVLARLRRLREHGIRIAVDDFGTGYSCLARLDTLPVDIIKVDKSLLHRAGTGEPAPLVDAAIGLAHALSLRVVVEGVENIGQADYLRSRDCDSGQGYLWARPAPWSELHAGAAPHVPSLTGG